MVYHLILVSNIYVLCITLWVRHIGPLSSAIQEHNQVLNLWKLAKPTLLCITSYSYIDKKYNYRSRRWFFARYTVFILALTKWMVRLGLSRSSH